MTIRRRILNRAARALGYETADARTAVHLAIQVGKLLAQVRAENLDHRQISAAAGIGGGR